MSKPRLKPGVVRDAILTYLRHKKTNASVSEISAAVSTDLGVGVAASSIRSYLNLNEGKGRPFMRTGRGQYCLSGGAEPARADRADHKGPVAQRDARAVFTHATSTLYQGDCLAWLKQQRPNSLHACVTDPPYGLVEYTPKEQTKLRGGRGGVWRIPPSFDGHIRAPLPRFTTLTEKDLTTLDTFFQDWARALYPVLVPGAHVIIASNPFVSYRVVNAVIHAGFERRGEVVRLVMTLRGGDRPKNAHEQFPDISVLPRSMYEPWLMFRKPLAGRAQDNLRKWKTGGLRRISDAQPFGDVIRSYPTRKEERALAPHPSLKPQAFLRQIVRAILPLGEGVILDSFAGSGSTLAAAAALGYRAIGIESDTRYVRVAKRGIPKLAALKVSDLCLNADRDRLALANDNAIPFVNSATG